MSSLVASTACVPRCRAAFLTAAMLLAGCSPTFNWRDLRPVNTPLQALMPCKPDTAERSLALAGSPTTLHMHSCETGGMTFAVAWAELPQESHSMAALEAWRSGTLTALRADAAQATGGTANPEINVPGASHAVSTQASGKDPRGEPVQVQAVYFARGRQVYQAAVYGPRLQPAVLTTFFEGLRLP
ncbi:MAG: hypothetical protein ACK40L_08665 [Hydrogenophaga sp.]